MRRFHLLGLGRLWLLLVAVNLGAAPSPTKKLIEFGWDEPDTGFLRQHAAEMDRTPFDGCVFHVNYARPGGGKGSFTWESWGTNAFHEPDLREAFDDLKALRFVHLKSNFLRFNTTPAKLDWFDDYTAVLSNARLAARLARAGQCPGILFDIEQYDGALFDYRRQRDAKTKTWDIYADQVRRRGREVMKAFQESYPDLTVFLTFGYSLPWAQSQGGRVALAECHYGLLAPFLDGLVEAAQGRTRLVDGHELSYGYKDAAQFRAGYKTMKTRLLPIVRDPDKYHRTFSLGFGVWMDYDWRKKGWDVADVSKNYFTPESFESSVRAALETADEYIWIYTETPHWWSAQGSPQKLPSAYVESLRRARP
jgi:ribulose bisphosphate carboxylase small subunit